MSKIVLNGVVKQDA